MARKHAFAVVALVGVAAAVLAGAAAAKGGPSPDPSVAVYVEQVPTASGSAVAKEPTPPPPPPSGGGTAAPPAAPVTMPPETTTVGKTEPSAKPEPTVKRHRVAPTGAAIEAHAVLPLAIWRKLAKEAGNDAGTLESLVASSGLQVRTAGVVQPRSSGGGVSLDTIVLIAVLCSITAAAIVVRVRAERSRSHVTQWDAGVGTPRRP